MRSRPILAAAAVLVGFAIAASSAGAAVITFQANMTGTKEVAPNVGDPNGSAVGSITLDSGTGGNTASATWDFTLSNLATPPVTDFHIHGPATTTQNATVFIGFGVPPGSTLTQTRFAGTASGLSSANMNTVFANPTNFYLNIHNGEHPGGAVRDQLPEPGSAALVGLSALGLLARRRRGA
jgi:hypothetical protein